MIPCGTLFQAVRISYKRTITLSKNDVFLRELTMGTVFFKQTKAVLLALTISTLSLLSISCGDGSDERNVQIPGVNGPVVTLLEDNVMISMVFENLIMDAGLRFNIPKYPNSYIELSPDMESEGTLLAFSISLQDIFDLNLETLDPTALPGGRPLPGILGGTLPSVAVQLDKLKEGTTLYIGKDIFGLFVPTNIDFQGIASFKYYSSGKRTGNLHLVGNDVNGENSGILLMLNMKTSVKKKLRKIANKYD